MRRPTIEYKLFKHDDGTFEKIRGYWFFVPDWFPIYNGGGFQPSDYQFESAWDADGASVRDPRPRYYKQGRINPCTEGLAKDLNDCGCQCCKECVC